MTETDRWGRPPLPVGEVFYTRGMAFRDGDYMIDAAHGHWQLRFTWRARRSYARRASGGWVFTWHSLAPGATRGPGRPIPPYRYAVLIQKEAEPTGQWTPQPDPKDHEPADPERSPSTTSSRGSWKLPAGLPPDPPPTTDVRDQYEPDPTGSRSIPA